MRSTICLVGAVAASALVVGAGVAGAAGTQAAKPTVLRCSLTLTTTPPVGTDAVLASDHGSQYGRHSCSTKGFGGGIVGDSFTVPDSGDTVGKITEYFRGGSIRGKFDLTPLPSEGISDTDFGRQSWEGTLSITGGTGVYKGIAPAKKKGTMTCTSPDSVHLKCKQAVKVVMP